MKVIIFSDASSYKNGKPDQIGGFCSIIVNEKYEILKTFIKIFDNTTNNFNELLAPMVGMEYAIKELKANEIVVVSDSQYVTKGVNERLLKWIRNGWKNSSGTVKNLELWKKMHQLLGYCERNNIKYEFIWQKGHKGKSIRLEENPTIYFQELCDSYAGKAMKKYLEKNQNKIVLPSKPKPSSIQEIKEYK